MKNYSLIAIGLLSFVSPLLAGSVPAVPEPGTFALLGGGIAGLILAERWRRSKKK